MAKIVSLDVETTGLDETTGDQIIQYCAIGWLGKGMTLPPVTRRVMPTREPTPETARVNRFSREEWARYAATPYNQTDVAGLASILDGAIVLSSNPWFDRRFIAEEAKRLGFDPPRWTHRSIDIASLAAPLLVSGQIEKTGLDHVAAYLGYNTAEMHDAIVDAMLALACFEDLCDLYIGGAWH